MTDERFTELADLYLDGEISEKELTCLKKELSADAHRRDLFVERSRLHKAMELALDPQAVDRRHRQDRRRPVAFPQFSRWLLGTGLAASLVLGWVLFSPAFWDHGGDSAFFVEIDSAGASEQDLPNQVLSDWSTEADLKRYASRQHRMLENERASLAAQFRLMGLRPALTPPDKELQAITLPASQAEPTGRRAALLNKLQRHAVMPKARILRSDADWDSYAEDGFESYGSGFESSLISFK